MQYRPIRFPTGEVRATTAALANVSKEKLIRLVNRHIRGDWGDTCMADQKPMSRQSAMGNVSCLGIKSAARSAC